MCTGASTPSGCGTDLGQKGKEVSPGGAKDGSSFTSTSGLEPRGARELSNQTWPPELLYS